MKVLFSSQTYSLSNPVMHLPYFPYLYYPIFSTFIIHFPYIYYPDFLIFIILLSLHLLSYFSYIYYPIFITFITFLTLLYCFP